MVAPADIPAVAPSGLTCISCGYDLATLPTVRPCPECGTPIERSFLGPLLRYAPEATLRTARHAVSALRLALTLGAISIFSVLLSFLVYTVLVAMLGTRPSASAPLEIGMGVVSVLCFLGLLVSAGAYVVGVVSLTSSVLWTTKQPRRPRIVTRYALVLLIPTAPAAAALRDSMSTVPLQVLAHTFGVVATLSLAVHYTELRTTMAGLARRCVGRPAIRPAGLGILAGALILLGSEVRAGWASNYVPLILFLVFVSLGDPIRLLFKAVRGELDHADVASTIDSPA